ncbi:MAG TPA: hypothetical protein VIE67_09770 [Rudaea sp.]|jgi:hypothetical protein|uniref:hypothetical protein n=1 Tax=Rudaea sp. TaxID=2136325 RepID=UPI002F95C3C5
MAQIQVKLDTSANPPVTTIPNHQSINNGNHRIEWTPFANETFTFVSLTGLPNPPFSQLSVTSSQITVQDDNTAVGEHAYTITVSYQGNNYTTSSTALYGKAGHPMVGGPSGPTIKNN